MDDPTFDRLTKALASGLSRRRLVRLLGGGLAGTAGGLLGQRAVTEAQGVDGCCHDSDCHALNPICATSVCDGQALVCDLGLSIGTGHCLTVPQPTQNGQQCAPSPTPCVGWICENGQCLPSPLTGPQCGPGTTCTEDVCVKGICTAQPANFGATCSSSNPCLQGTTCQADGTCSGALIRCTASDACHVAGTCDFTTGQCTNPIADDGTPCPRTNPCFQSYICIQGVCTGTDPIICTAQDQCHSVGTCDATTGRCSNPLAADGTPCDDGNACTHNDTCQAGVCTGTLIDCAPPDQCHTAVHCDPRTGQCPYPAVPDGTSCDDGNACTRPDTCQGGICTGTPVVCTAQDQCHDVGTCDPSTGRCTNPVKPDGTACNDGNACTHNDTCQAGVCTGGNPVVCTASDQCHVRGGCDPSTGLCSNPVAADGTPCNADNNACTVGDACQNGVCVAGPAVVCSTPDACHAPGTCDPTTGQCSAPTLTAGSCTSGRIKDGPCDCDGTCCAASDNCVGQPGNRRCQAH